jgi:hypothetical protein
MARVRTPLVIVSCLWIALGTLLLVFPSCVAVSTALFYYHEDPDLFNPLGLAPLVLFFGIGLLFSALAVTNGIMMLKHLHRRSSLVLSCILLLVIPLGTILGIASLFLLTRDEVEQLYRA